MAKKAKQKSKGKAPPTRGRWLRRFLVLAVWGFVVLLGVVAFYAYDLPDVDNLGERTRTPSVRLVSIDGVQFARFGDAYATPVHVADLPDHLRFAVLATEDRRFYSHFGLDVIALVRAALANLKAGRVVQGASTLTQQSHFLNVRRTYSPSLPVEPATKTFCILCEPHQKETDSPCSCLEHTGRCSQPQGLLSQHCTP